jgi:hypothetical protein
MAISPVFPIDIDIAKEYMGRTDLKRSMEVTSRNDLAEISTYDYLLF